MFDHFETYWLAAALLGLTVGLDPFINGQRSALVTHPLASMLLSVLVRTQAGPTTGGLTVANALLALLAVLALSCLWSERTRDESTGLVLISIAMVFGVACGAGEWTIAAVTWTAMLGLHIRRVSLATEPGASGSGERNQIDTSAPLEFSEWPSDWRWVRQMAQCPRPQPTLFERLGFAANPLEAKLRLQ